jgi:hypothetical protein
VLDADQPHRAIRCPAALRRAPRVQDLEAVPGLLVQRHVGVAEHDEVGALAEAPPHPLEAIGARAGVVDHRDAGTSRLDDPLLGQQPPQLGAVHVAVHANERRSDRLEVAQHLERREVAGVQEQVRRPDPLDARVGQPPRPARHVRVGYDGDDHRALH